MLERGGLPFRGFFVYGMSGRLGWTAGNPSPLWRLWDSFDIQHANLIGYWDPNSPVKADNTNVIVTVYQHPTKILLAVGSWAKAQLIVNFRLIGTN